MYLAVARMAFQRQLAYRTANLAGLATNSFFALLRAYVLIALFGAQGAVAGYSVRDAVTYTGLSQAMLSLLAIYGWWDVIRSIRTGEVGTELSRPLDFLWYWLAQDVGRAVGHLLLRGVPLLVVYALVYDIVVPADALQWGAVSLAVGMALVISFAWRFMVSVTAFWARDSMGIARLAWNVSIFLSGFLMPVSFFPEWLVILMNLTPFPSMLNTPIEVFLNHAQGDALWRALGVQLGWVVVMILGARMVLNAGVKKLVIQGG